MNALPCRLPVHGLSWAIVALLRSRFVAVVPTPWASARTMRPHITVRDLVVTCRPWIALVVLALLWAFAAAAPATAAAPPVNDAFSAAAAIRGEEGQSETTNAGATKESGEPAHAGNAGGASVWFQWTAPRDGSFAFDTAESDFDTVLAVYTGPALSALVQLAADDDSGPRLRSELSFRAVAGTVYRVSVDGFQGKVGRVRLAWRSAPSNDNFAHARTIEGHTGTIESVGVGATKEAGEPNHSQDFEADQSVWFRWTAPRDMRVGFVVRDGGTLAAYTGATLVTLVPAAEGPTPVLDAKAGTAYQIAVEGAADDAVLSWRPAQPNDDLAQAARIFGRSGRVRGSNFPASKEAGEPDHGGPGSSVWYRWQAPRTGFLLLRTTNNTGLAVYRGSRLSRLRQLAGGASAVPIEVQRRRVYRIAVDGSNVGDFVLRWRFRRTVQPNDDFAEAATVVGGSGHVRGSNFPASAEPGEPRHGAAAGSVWYRWRAPRTGVLHLRTSGITFDTVLAVYRGSRLNRLRQLAGDDDSGPGLASSVRIDVQRGRVYRVAVDGFSVGEFVLRWSLTPRRV